MTPSLPLRFRLIVLAALVAVAGCRSSGPLVRDAPEPIDAAGFPNHTAAQIVAQIARTAPVASFESQARVAVRSAKLDQDVTATIRSRRSDTLLAMVRGPLGIEVGRALVTPDSLFALDQLQGRLYVGPAALADRYVPGAVRPEALFESVLGVVVPETDVRWRVRAHEGVYLLDDPGPRRRTYVVDPALWRVTRYQERGEQGELLDERVFEAFDTVDSVIVARRVSFRRPADAAAVTIEHRKLRLNPEGLRFPFSPGDARRRPLQ